MTDYSVTWNLEGQLEVVGAKVIAATSMNEVYDIDWLISRSSLRNLTNASENSGSAGDTRGQLGTYPNVLKFSAQDVRAYNYAEIDDPPSMGYMTFEQALAKLLEALHAQHGLSYDGVIETTSSRGLEDHKRIIVTPSGVSVQRPTLVWDTVPVPVDVPATLRG